MLIHVWVSKKQCWHRISTPCVCTLLTDAVGMVLTPRGNHVAQFQAIVQCGIKAAHHHWATHACSQPPTAGKAGGNGADVLGETDALSMQAWAGQ